MTEPGWYPDPSAPQGASRFWDGHAWTDRVVVEKPPAKGIPAWVLVAWFALMAVVAFAGFWFVLLMTAFGCDSGWDGCVGAGEATWFIYVGICAVGLIVLLVWSLVSRTAGPRIAAFILMPVVVALGVVVSTGAYMLMAQVLT